MIPYNHDVQNRVHTITCIPAERQIKQCSIEQNGVWRMNRYAVSRVVGNKSVDVWIVRDDLNSIKNARDLTSEIVGQDTGWTYPRMARDIVRWLEISQAPTDDVRVLVPSTWHYQLCTASRSEWAWQYDITSAYWQICSRAKSPLFSIHNGKIRWQTISRQQQSRWDKLCEVFDLDKHASKQLRLALIGVNAAGWNRGLSDHVGGCISYCNGKRMESTVPPTALQPLALLAVRSTYEITQIQSELVSAIYANADCVITESIEEMTYWQHLNIRHAMQAEGPCQINHLGSYQIGNKSTKLFDLSSPMIAHCKPQPLENLTWHRQFLSA